MDIQNPTHGNIICRFEMVTEGEIIDAIRRPPGARSLDGIKRRTGQEWDDASQVSVPEKGSSERAYRRNLRIE